MTEPTPFNDTEFPVAVIDCPHCGESVYIMQYGGTGTCTKCKNKWDHEYCTHEEIPGCPTEHWLLPVDGHEDCDICERREREEIEIERKRREYETKRFEHFLKHGTWLDRYTDAAGNTFSDADEGL